MKDDFVAFIKSALAEYPQLTHTLKLVNAPYSLNFPAQDSNGFGVEIQFDDDGGVVFTERAIHFHFDFQDGFRNDVGYNEAFDSTFAAIMELTLDLLTPRMRIIEFTAGNGGKFKGAYKWYLEGETDGQWIHLDTMAFIFWNYFGRRDHKILQNEILPIRNDKSPFAPAQDSQDAP